MRTLTRALLLFFGVIMYLLCNLSCSKAEAQALAEERSIAPEVKYRKYTLNSPPGQVTLHMILIDSDALKEGRICLEPIMARETVGGSSSPEAIAKKVGGIAAINGPYFASAGGRVYPLGFTVIDGIIAQLGNENRPLVGIDSSGELKIQVAHPQAFVTSDAYFDPIFLWGINTPAGEENVTLYDRRWGTNITLRDGIGVTILPYKPESTSTIIVGPSGRVQDDWDGLIVSKQTSSPIEIPHDGWVLVFRGRSIPSAERYQVGNKVSFYIYELPSRWEKMRWIVTLGPWFVHEGNPRDYSTETRYSGNITGRAPRTVIGNTWNGEIFLAVTTGAPLNITETANILTECNVREAVMCDSGSSSGMWVNGIGTIGNNTAVPMAFVVRGIDAPLPQTKPLRVWQGRLHRH